MVASPAATKGSCGNDPMPASCPTPSSLPVSMRLEDVVQFVGKSPYKWRETAHSNTTSQYALLVALIGWGLATDWICRTLRISWRVCGFVALLIPLVFVLWLITQWCFRRRSLRNLPQAYSGLTKRIVCVARPDWLAQHGEFMDVPFEPSIHFTLDLVKSTTYQKWAFGLTFLGIFALVYLVAKQMGSGFIDMGPLKVWGSWLGAYAFNHVVVWPTYLRVLPGRLDVMRFNSLPGGRTVTKSIPLRNAHLLIDLHKYAVLITVDGESTEVPFLLIRGRSRFAHSLIRAALSTHTAPPLPDDEFLG